MGHLQRKILILLVISFFIAGIYSFEETYPEPATCESDEDCLRGKAKCIRGECHCTEKLAIGDGKKECKVAGVTLCPSNSCQAQNSRKFKNSYCLINPATNKKVCKCDEGYFGRAKASRCVKADARGAYNYYVCLTGKNCPTYSRCHEKGVCSCKDELTGDGVNCRPPPPTTCLAHMEVDPYRQCHRTHAKCIKEICRCVGMYVGDGVKCRKGSPCPKDVKCEKNARCMIDPLFPKTPKCVCTEGHRKSKGGNCERMCKSNKHCPKTYSMCVDGVCWCREELVLGEKSCDPAPLHPCKTDKDCHSKAKCHVGECYCQGKYVGNGEKCRKAKSCSKSKCGGDSTCLVDPLRSKHVHCKCNTGYLYDAKAKKCVVKSSVPSKTAEPMYTIDETYPAPAICESDSDCLKGKAKCIRRECHCTEKLAIGDGKTECKVAGVTLCSSNFCAMKNSYNFAHSYCLINPATKKKVCKCKEGYFGRPKAITCEKGDARSKTLHYLCLTKKNCPIYSRCANNHRCACLHELYGDGENCRAYFPPKCYSNKVCKAKQGRCSRGICHCTGMYAGFGKFCRKATPCPDDIKCGPTSRCMVDPLFPKTPKCVCSLGYYKSEAGKCERSCTGNKHCTKTYSICVKHLCQCKEELVHGPKSCDPAPLHPCKTDKDCHSKAKCHVGECYCQGKYVGNGEKCRQSKSCSKKLKDLCGAHATCMVDPLRTKHAHCRCSQGYHFHADTKTCVECLKDRHCTKTHSICVNTKCGCKDELVLGKTSCEAAPLHICRADTDCDSRAKCVKGNCICQGKTIGNGKYCRDTQACSTEHQCGPNSYCAVDPLLPEKSECKCNKGYTKSADGNCRDADECSTDAATCPENSACKNTEGSYDCECIDGYQKNDNNICDDVDECSENEDACGTNEQCVNEPGKFSCQCQSGYIDKGGACVRTDECNNECRKHEVCYKGKCKCKKGHKKDKKGHCYKVKFSGGLYSGSGVSLHVVSSYILSALILGMLGRLACTA